jgi:Na+-translocating ferredoxin:NAD+ oxidoreductase RnfE subunit
VAYLWVVLAGAIVFTVASFLPWVGISFLGSAPANFNMWMVLGLEPAYVVFADVVFRVSLGLALMSVAVILTLALIQLLRRRVGKGLTIGMFILSLVPLIPLFWSLLTFRPLLKAVLGKESSLGVIFGLPGIGYLLTFVGSLTIIVGSAIGFFSKKRGLNKA